MKRLLLFLIMMPVISAYSLKSTKSFTCDFTNPGSLLPPIYNIPLGEPVDIADRTFTSDDGMLTIRFTMGSMSSPQIFRDSNGQSRLYMSPYSSVIISVVEGSHISRFRIPGTNRIAGLDLEESVPVMEDNAGLHINESQNYYEWPTSPEGRGIALQQEYTSLTFTNNSPSVTNIERFIIDYQIDMLEFDISLPSGAVQSIPEELTLIFSETIGSVNNTIQPEIIDETGTVVAKTSATLVDNTHVKLTLPHAITEIGIYNLTIPEKLVYGADGKIFNSSNSYTYTIGNLPSQDTKAKAQALLALRGPGYPSQNSEARQTLASLGPKASEEDYQAAIANYYATTDVEMPENGKYYTIFAVDKVGAKAYLKYADGKLSLTKVQSDAVALQVETDGTSIKLKTSDSKYLTLPGATESSISDDATPLTFAKMGLVEGASYEDVFGLFSIYGSMGTANTYAQVNVQVPMFMTNENLSNLLFSNSLTSAFVVEAMPDDFVYDFLKIADVYWKESVAMDTPVKDVTLNNFTFYCYDREIGVSNNDVILVNYNTNAEIARGKFKVVSSDPDIPGAKGIIKLQLNKTIIEGSLSAGLYCYVIEKATFGDKNYGDYCANPDAYLSSGRSKSDCHVNSYLYHIVTVNNNYTPDPDKPRPSDAVLAKAQEVLSKKGIGYPADNASSRQTLQSLVNSGEGTDEVFNAAIQAYLAETNIQLPTAGKYYSITAVAANNNKAYVQDAATLSADASKAGAFKAGVSGSAITFENKNGKFLTVLTAAGSLTDAFSAADNSLTLARYPVSGSNAEATFGLMTISGSKNGTTMMSQVNVSTLAITTSGNTAVFTNEATSAFCLADTSEPSPDPVPEAQYTLSPTSGSQVGGMKLEVTLTFTNISNVTVADKGKIKLNQTIQPTSVTPKEDNTQFAIVFTGLTPGTYTLQIDEGAFTYLYNGKTAAVQAISATYTMTEKAVPSADVLERAETLLAMTGVGYPATDSPVRLALKKLVDAKEGSNAEFNAAIDAYLADTNIEKPASGKYYRMATCYKDASKYVALDGNKLTLISPDNVKEADVFTATANADGTTILTAVNNKYLTLPSPGECLSITYNKAIHDLTLSRLKVENFTDEETFGKISISLNGKYALFGVGYQPGIIMEPSSAPRFDSSTSAIRFEEVSESEIIHMPDVGYTIIPGAGSSVETLEKITVTFDTTNKVTLKDAGKVKLVNYLHGNTIAPKSIKAVENAQNTFDIEFINIPADTYNLLMEKGAFVVNFMGREEPVQEIIVRTITVKNEPTLAMDFDTYYNLTWTGKDYYIFDTSLKNFKLKADTSIELITDDPSVSITTWDIYTEIASGHFEKTNDSKVVLLVLDTELKKTLNKGEYHVRIMEKTICDSNYIQYLADNESISLSSCHVNKKLDLMVNVDNEQAAEGIHQITIDEQNDKVYDLSGRRMDGNVKPGLYIMNGKKVVVK